MVKLKRLMVMLFVFAVCLNFLCPASFASDDLVSSGSGDGWILPGGMITPYGAISTDFASWLVDEMEDNLADRWHMVRSLVDSSYCPDSSNHRHNFVKQHTQVGNEFGNYYVCEYCRQTAGEVMEDAYDDYVETLPASGLTSSGGMLYQLRLTDMTHIEFCAYTSGSTRFEVDSSVTNGVPAVNVISTLNTPVTYGEYDAHAVRERGCSFNPCWMVGYTRFIAPITGTYSLVKCPAIQYRAVDSYGTVYSGVSDWCNSGYALGYRAAGGQISIYSDKEVSVFSSSIGVETFDVTWLLPVVSIVPDTAINTTTGIQYNNTTVYDIDSRPSSITGDYGIMGNNNELTKIDTQTIINEGDSTVYSPSTGDTVSFESWDYDYSTRTYSLSLTGGDTMTVTYGDENVTINEGGDTYNIYYLVQAPVQEEEPVPAHTHTYSEVVTRQPSCTLAGVKTFTCTECSASYQKEIPALGHDWQVKTQVQSEYDENGDLETQGYTIYKCSRCGEERRSDDGVPPASGGGDGGLISTDSNGLQELRDKLVTFFQEFPAMFGEMTDFLQEGFSYIPDDIMSMITFAVGLSVVMGIFKFFWR